MQLADTLASPKVVLPLKVQGIVLFLLFSSVYFLADAHLASDNLKIRFTISSLTEEAIQLFWPVNGDGENNLAQKVLILRPGSHKYYFLITDPYDLKWLRFDPATRSSSIAVEEVAFGWGPKREIFLSGANLYEALETVQQVSKEKGKDSKEVLIVSKGIDPIININLSKLTRPLRFYQHVRSLVAALCVTFIAGLLLRYLNSSNYSSYSHETYPKNSRQWGIWGLVCFSIGGYFILATPIEISKHYNLLYILTTAYLVGFTLFFPLFWFSTRRVKENFGPVSCSRFAWLWFALPCFIVWLFYLCSFWPASMSPDSLDQWRQVLKGSFKDWHPAFHTLNIWLITRFAMTPAAVGIIQIVVLGSTVGWTLSVLQRYGIPRSILWVTSLLVALWPVNGLMVVTLWKDVAFSVVLLILAMYLFQVVMSRGAWLGTRKNWLLLGGVLALVSLYRHNGIVPALLTICTLFLFYPRSWKGITVAACLAIALHAGIRGPLYEVIEVKRGNPVSRVMQSLKKDFLEPDEAGIKTDGPPQKIDERPQIASMEDANTNSDILLERIYSSSRLWRIQPMTFFHKRMEYVNLWVKKKGDVSKVKYISGNKVGIKENSIIPVGRDLIYTLFYETTHKKYLFWMWRPAVYLYALSALLVMLSWRHRERMYLILLPALFNSLPIFLVVVHKSIFRYHYPLVILGVVLILPLLFFKPLEQNCRPYSKKSVVPERPHR